jgi:uncharacterized membrane protein
MASDTMFLLLTTYDSKEDAKADLDAVHELYKAEALKTYDAAIVVKGDDGKVHIEKYEKPTQAGALGGAAAGAILSILFPPSLLAFGVVGAAAGGLIGHFWKGMSRGDVKELGEAMDVGQVALVVVAQTDIEEATKKAVRKGTKQVSKEIKAESKEFAKDLEAAEKDWEKSF